MQWLVPAKRPVCDAGETLAQLSDLGLQVVQPA
jgi:hypothetical protein